MIISIWKPKYLNVNKKRIVDHFFLIENDEFIEKEYLNCKVTYTCDVCNSDNINITSSKSLFISKYNNIENQTCRSCRSKISEYEIKKTYIEFPHISKSISEEGYQIISKEVDYMRSDNRSQFKINVICHNGHEHTITWNNWNRGRRCRECYEEDKYNNAIKYKDNFDLYMFEVIRLTEITYRDNKSIIDPHSYRGSDYHLDHIFSKYDGFINNIDPKIISSKVNLKMVKSTYNLSKGKKSDISLIELMERYRSN